MYELQQRINTNATDVKGIAEEWLVVSITQKPVEYEFSVERVIKEVLGKAEKIGIFDSKYANVIYLHPIYLNKISDIDEENIEKSIKDGKKNALVNVAIVFDRSAYFGSKIEDMVAFNNFGKKIYNIKKYKPICSMPSMNFPFIKNKKSCVEKRFCFECNSSICTCEKEHSCLHRLLCLIIYGRDVYDKDLKKRELPLELWNELLSTQ